MKKWILFLVLIAAFVLGAVAFLLGRDYNQTLVKDKPTSSSVASSKSSSHKSSKSSSATSETLAIPKALTLSGAQTDEFAKWVGDQAEKMRLAGSALNLQVDLPDANDTDSVYYHTVNGPLYINGTNAGRGLQAEGIFGFYVWDAYPVQDSSGKQNYDGTIGYQPAQTVKFTLGANYGHVADTTNHSMDMYIVANDGNIYEFKLAQGASSLAPLYGDEHASENDVVGQVTQDEAAKAELNHVVGYQADKVSESFNY
ncbi:hypothetical protein [Weissella confusa]|uniref:hypothetical protein n=1 Tax=Weissella confusa TaxID=1583 RepID=UPI0018F193AB|nr:hypothetical protein [Weissella confusa]MBJ7649937.1 hypothetical protein [Weissella confusa]MBJ7661838.1 hypothetical protein [Weissella confusa]